MRDLIIVSARDSVREAMDFKSRIIKSETYDRVMVIPNGETFYPGTQFKPDAVLVYDCEVLHKDDNPDDIEVGLASIDFECCVESIDVLANTISSIYDGVGNVPIISAWKLYSESIEYAMVDFNPHATLLKEFEKCVIFGLKKLGLFYKNRVLDVNAPFTYDRGGDGLITDSFEAIDKQTAVRIENIIVASDGGYVSSDLFGQLPVIVPDKDAIPMRMLIGLHQDTLFNALLIPESWLKQRIVSKSIVPFDAIRLHKEWDNCVTSERLNFALGNVCNTIRTALGDDAAELSWFDLKEFLASKEIAVFVKSGTKWERRVL